jgi:hypothetical protein
VLLERSPPATLRAHCLSNLFDLAESGLEDMVVAVVSNVIQVFVFGCDDAGVCEVELGLRHAVVWHDRHAFGGFRCADEVGTVAC